MPHSTATELSRGPDSLRLLHAASPPRSGGWLARVVGGEGVRERQVEEAHSVAATLAWLREASFDAVVVSHEPGVIDAAELSRGLRGVGQGEAVVVLTDTPDPGTETLCHEAGADAVCPATHATPQTLVATIRRAVAWRRVLRDNQRLKEEERQRLAAEHRATERTLADQRKLVRQLEAIDHQSHVSAPALAGRSATFQAAPPPDAEDRFAEQYEDLLRAYTVLGAGSLAGEIEEVAAVLAAAGVAADRVVRLHLLAVEELLAGLGPRGVRHVIGRADLLVLEVIAKLADHYRRGYDSRPVLESPTRVPVPVSDPPAEQPAA